METMSSYCQTIETLCVQARELVTALKSMAEVFAQEAVRLFRHDQVTRLRELRARVLHKANNIEREETAASYGATKASLSIGTAMLALGGLAAVATHNRRPLSFGAHLSKTYLSKDVPFGTVRVAIGPGGLPDNVILIPLSRLSRESGKTEPDVEAALKAAGYLPMTSEAFSRFMNDLEGKVLDGSMSLPMTLEQISSGLTFDQGSSGNYG